MRLIVFFAAALAAILTESRTAAAEYNSVAAACVVDGATLPTVYLTTEGTVMHKPTATARITLFCPITKPIAAPRHLELLYFSTENDSATFVKATYLKMNKSNGLSITVATASSRNGPNDDVSAHNITADFSDSYNPSSFVYYIKIELQRRNTDQNVLAYKVTAY
jgi:hypothetical protein